MVVETVVEPRPIEPESNPETPAPVEPEPEPDPEPEQPRPPNQLRRTGTTQ